MEIDRMSNLQCAFQTLNARGAHRNAYEHNGTHATTGVSKGAPVHIGFRDEPIEGQTENPLKL